MDSEDLYNSDFIEIDGNKIHKTAIIYDNVVLGKGNHIGAYSVIGTNGSIRNTDQSNFKGKIIIGDNNIISEHCTIQTPYNDYETTLIGNNNFIMPACHIGHNSVIGNNVEICTGSVIAGHVTIKDNVKIKIGCMIKNRVEIGTGAMIGIGSVVINNIKDNDSVFGNPAKPIYK